MRSKRRRGDNNEEVEHKRREYKVKVKQLRCAINTAKTNCWRDLIRVITLSTFSSS